MASVVSSSRKSENHNFNLQTDNNVLVPLMNAPEAEEAKDHDPIL